MGCITFHDMHASKPSFYFTSTKDHREGYVIPQSSDPQTQHTLIDNILDIWQLIIFNVGLVVDTLETSDVTPLLLLPSVHLSQGQDLCGEDQPRMLRERW